MSITQPPGFPNIGLAKPPRLLRFSDGTVVDLNKIVYVGKVLKSSHKDYPFYRIHLDHGQTLEVGVKAITGEDRILDREVLIKAWKDYLGES